MKRLLLSAILALAFTAVAVATPAPTEAATAPAILKWSSAIPGWNDAYYWYDTDGARYAFAPTAAFQSWFPGEPTGVTNASIAELAPIALQGAVPHRPGARLIQFESSPNVYAVDRFGVLRWITTEQVALELYDAHWPTLIDTLSVADYPLYRFGSPITDAAEFDPHAWDHLTSPATNVINATRPIPDAFNGTLTLQASLQGDLTVGQTITFTADVHGQNTSPSDITIRIYDTHNQVIGVCAAASMCRIEHLIGGPTGDQQFIARAFNPYGQATSSAPIIRFVKNP